MKSARLVPLVGKRVTASCILCDVTGRLSIVNESVATFTDATVDYKNGEPAMRRSPYPVCVSNIVAAHARGF